MAGFAQAVVNLKRLVEVWIVDEALPAEGGARLFEVDAHDEAELLGEFADRAFEQLGVLARGFGVMNRTRADDDEQTAVFAVEDVDDLVAGFENGSGGRLGDRQLLLKKSGWEDDFRPGYAKVISGIEHRIHFLTGIMLRNRVDKVGSMISVFLSYNLQVDRDRVAVV